MGLNDQEELEQNDDNEGKVGLSSTLDLFKEYDEVKKMILDIPMDSKTFVVAEKKFEDFKTILDLYQEQPHLLDPHLESLLDLLVNIIRDGKDNKEDLPQAFIYLWLIVKVRGYKHIVKILPHEVRDLMPILHLLEQQKVDDNFYGSYVLLMWLSIIILMPFNIKRFDDTAIGNEEGKIPTKSVIDRILDEVKSFLGAPHSSREMAAYLASKFVTRPDLKETYLPQFIDYCFKVANIEDDTSRRDLFNKMGVIRSLGLIFKHGRREELLPYCNDVLTRFVASYAFKEKIRPLRKLSIKLVQRVGLAFLKPRVASWRYQRGSRSLATNITGNKPNSHGEYKEVSETDNEDVAPEIEDVIEILLQGLQDHDTVVRWSAAKGIGRVTSRLPRSMADDVICATLDLFSARENDKAWHGGCLALAELARRGLFLPDRLADVMPILERALVYDELRGQSSVGSNIRDAACYLCWAFARAYHPSQISPYVQQLATGLLIVSLFDREIPCRRAGSAAFQEHVGRQGAFPHGIDILTTVDYFAVGNRVNAFLSLSEHVGRYPEYTKALVDHLHNKKVGHWDSAVRDLTAKALGKLTRFEPTYVKDEILPKLLESSVGPVLIVRHGSILASAHIILTLSKLANTEGKKELALSKELVSKTCSIVAELDSRKLFRGIGGEYMRQATSVLIEKCSNAKLPIEQTDVIDRWCNLLEDNLIYVDENIRNVALEALPVFFQEYYLSEGQQTFRQETVAKYVKGLSSENENQSIGFACALGCLPQKFFEDNFFDLVLKALLQAIEIKPSTVAWAQTRKEAINSIVKLRHIVGVSDKSGCDSFGPDNVKLLLEGLILAMKDYTMDRRGDVGAWVREAAMNALKVLCKAIVEADASMMNEDIVQQIMQHVSQQCVERIDRTRKLAGVTFFELLYGHPQIPYVPEREKLEEIFPLEWCQDCNWASESYTLQNFARLMDLPVYRSPVVLGLTYSLGGGSANLTRYSCEALRVYLNDRATDHKLLKDFMEAVIQLFVRHRRKDRITQPLLKSLSELFSSCNALDQVLEEQDLLSQFIYCVRQECVKCTDFHKLSSVVTILCELLRIESPLTPNILTHLSIFLGYQYPKVRTIAATSLLTALQEYNDRVIVPEEVVDEVCDILEDTSWLDGIEEARKKRNELCILIGIAPPQVRKKD